MCRGFLCVNLRDFAGVGEFDVCGGVALSFMQEKVEKFMCNYPSLFADRATAEARPSLMYSNSKVYKKYKIWPMVRGEHNIGGQYE